MRVKQIRNFTVHQPILNASWFMKLNYFPLHSIDLYSRRFTWFHSLLQSLICFFHSFFGAVMRKANYLIPVSVTKYLCHSSMSSKNFNDRQTHTSDFFSVLIASHRGVKWRRFESETFFQNFSEASSQQWVWFWLILFEFAMWWKNGFHYFIQFLKILIV